MVRLALPPARPGAGPADGPLEPRPRRCAAGTGRPAGQLQFQGGTVLESPRGQAAVFYDGCPLLAGRWA